MINLKIGDKKGRLTFIKECEPEVNPRGKKYRRGVFLCDCGNTHNTRLSKFNCDDIESCGCLRLDNFMKKCATNPHYKTAIYNCWSNMIQRCTNTNNTDFNHYGGRGITVCEEWKDFNNFYEDMKDGHLDDLTLDRIDNNSSYNKDNCRWATRKQQGRNRRCNLYLEHKGESLCASEWAEKIGMSKACFYDRLRRGWSAKDCIEIPRKGTRRILNHNI